MSELNVPSAERDALRAIDTDVLGRLIEQSMYDGQSDALRRLRLDSCGPYVASRLQEYGKALTEHGAAKAAKKRAETEYRARRAGSDLTHAVRQMKDRARQEEEESQFFYVEDQIAPPYSFSERISVRVCYRWRGAAAEEWVYGSTTFTHEVRSRPDYTKPLPKQKPSAAKQERDRQETLYRDWEYLKMLGLNSVREHFRRGGGGATVPQTLHAKTDSYTGGLNNFSADF